MSKKVKINFQKEYALYKACAKKDNFRPSMEMVHFKDGCAYASESHILVKVPLCVCTNLNEEFWGRLEGFSVNGKVLKFIYGFDEIFVDKNEENDTCHIVGTMGGSEFRIQLQRTGDVGAPNFDSVLKQDNEKVPVGSIGLNTKRLSDLANALGTEVTELNFCSSNKPTRIETADGAIGMIVPVMIAD